MRTAIRTSVSSARTYGQANTQRALKSHASFKDLKVIGSLLVVKVGTKVKNIRLVEGGYDIDCKIDSIESMARQREEKIALIGFHPSRTFRTCG